jgi:L-asparagine transporter-like permease
MLFVPWGPQFRSPQFRGHQVAAPVSGRGLAALVRHVASREHVPISAVVAYYCFSFSQSLLRRVHHRRKFLFVVTTSSLLLHFEFFYVLCPVLVGHLVNGTSVSICSITLEERS